MLGEKTPAVSPNITLKPRKNKIEQKTLFAENLAKLLPTKPTKSCLFTASGAARGLNVICGPHPAYSEQKITPAGSRRKVKTWYLCVFLSAELGTRTEPGNNGRSIVPVFFSLKVTFLLQCHLSAQPSRRSGSNQLRELSADFSGPLKRSSGIVLRSQISEKTGKKKKSGQTAHTFYRSGARMTVK